MQVDVSILKIPLCFGVILSIEKQSRVATDMQMFSEINVQDTYEWLDSEVRQIVQIGEHSGQDGLRKVRNGVKLVSKALSSIAQDMAAENQKYTTSLKCCHKLHSVVSTCIFLGSKHQHVREEYALHLTHSHAWW